MSPIEMGVRLCGIANIHGNRDNFSQYFKNKKALRETQTLCSKVRILPACHEQTLRQDRLQYTVLIASTQCKDVRIIR